MTKQSPEDFLTKDLKQGNIEVSKQNFTGDSSYPTEWTVSVGAVRGLGPTFDIALTNFALELLKVSTELMKEFRSLFKDDQLMIEDSSDDWYERRDKALKRVAMIIGEDRDATTEQ